MAEGYKDWAAGDILTAADLEDYTVKQSVMRFADASARTTALSGVLAEGMMSYLKDTNSVEVYDGSAWAAVGQAGGKILQVVTATYSTEETTTSTTAAATSLTATITPTATTSDILIHLVVPWRGTRTSSSQYSGVGYHAIYRGGTEILEQYLGQTNNPGSSVIRWLHVIGPLVHLDSPATTSATTYTLYHRTATGQTLETFVNDYPGYMILMEVGA